MGMTVVIPITGPADDVAGVVRAAAASSYVTGVMAIAHAGTADPTLRRASDAGARTLTEPGAGRGSLVAAAIDAADDDAVIFLDPDLRGLITHHVDMLAWPIANERAAMARGLLDSGALVNPIFEHVLPVLTRQRSVRRELLDSLEPRSVADGNFESDLERLACRTGTPTHVAVLEGVSQPARFSANSQFGPVAGTLGRALQYAAHPLGLRIPHLPDLGGIEALARRRSA